MRKSRLLSVLLALAITVVGLPLTALADTYKVVTIGADLSDEQKEEMYKYFGTSKDEVTTIEVTNADERKYMEGIATEAQIGTRTLSCSYVEPTEEGGVRVKVANLTFVTGSMIASTLLTSGVKNCNVVAACPIAVSGTGALTGIMMAYEKATGEELDEEMKETATEELVTISDLADEIGREEATELMNTVKDEIIKGDIKDEDKIRETVEEVADKIGISLSDSQIDEIVRLMSKIAKYDYDKDALRNALKGLRGTNTENLITNIINTIKEFFTGSEGAGIIDQVNDDVLGDDVVVDSTEDNKGSDETAKEEASDQEEVTEDTSDDTDAEDSTDQIENMINKLEEKAPKGLFEKIKNFVKSLFGDEN